MQILSTGDGFVALAGDHSIRWVKGTHTAGVCSGTGEVDVFTFAWEKNEPSQLDFTSALQNYLEYANEAN